VAFGGEKKREEKEGEKGCPVKRGGNALNDVSSLYILCQTVPKGKGGRSRAQKKKGVHRFSHRRKKGGKPSHVVGGRKGSVCGFPFCEGEGVCG